MLENKEIAQFLMRLARSKGNWGAKYDRLEHFKKFQNRDKIVKELHNRGWLLVKKKPDYTGVSLNSKHKKEILGFIRDHLPSLKDILR